MSTLIPLTVRTKFGIIFSSVTEQVFEMSLARPGPNGSQMIRARFNEFLIIKYLA